MGERHNLAAIYIRVSTTEQAQEGYSLSAQERKLRDYCKLKGYTIYQVYTDAGCSAKDIRHRPQMQRLIADGLSGKFDVVVVWKLTRFTRNLSDLCTTCDKLEKRNVYLESYSESFDSRTPVGRMIRGILGVIAQWEREVISENVRLAMKERALQGKRTFSYMLGYNATRDGKIAVNHAEAKVVRYIFNEYERRRSLTVVAQHCKKRGYVGKMGAVFDPYSIFVILTRFAYCGYYSWHRQPIKADFEPIITVEQYNRVQSIIEEVGKTRGSPRKHPLVYL